MLNIKSLGVVVLAASAVCAPAMADERAVNTLAGAAVGAAIGNHSGGRDGAIVGGILGAAIGNSVSTRDNGYSNSYYESRPRSYVDVRYQQPVTYVEPVVTYYEPAPVYYAPPPRYYAPAVVVVGYGGGYYRGYSHHRGHGRH